jgi:hypothetical protein
VNMGSDPVGLRKSPWTDWGTIIEIVDGLEGVGPSAFDYIAEEVANASFGVVSNMTHVFLHGLETIVLHDWVNALQLATQEKDAKRTRMNQLNALVVCSNLLKGYKGLVCVKTLYCVHTALRSLSTSLMLRHPELPGY